MQSGDRVMVYDSPGFPLDHYLYATVLTPSDAGAVVVIDHPGNPRHAQQTFVAKDKIRGAKEVLAQRDQMKANLAAENDADRRATLREHIKGLEFMAAQLAE